MWLLGTVADIFWSFMGGAKIGEVLGPREWPTPASQVKPSPPIQPDSPNWCDWCQGRCQKVDPGKAIEPLAVDVQCDPMFEPNGRIASGYPCPNGHRERSYIVGPIDPTELHLLCADCGVIFVPP